MKRSTKTWLIIGAALVLLGALAVLGVLAANGWEFPSSEATEYETRTFEIAEAFTDISVEADTEDVRFVPAGDGKCRVEIHTGPKKEVSAAVQNGTLSVKSLEVEKWYNRDSLFSFGSENATITVYLPNSEYGRLRINEHTCDVNIPKEFSFASVDIAVTTGDIEYFASAAGAIAIKTDTGSVRVQGVGADALTVSVSTGHVLADAVECSALGVSVSTGRATVSNSSCESFTSTGSTGELNLANVTVSGKLYAKRSTGDIRFDMCDAAELEIETDTGDVTGSLLTEKVFIAKSDTGRVEVPDTAAGGVCRVTTDTGDIKIEIP